MTLFLSIVGLLVFLAVLTAAWRNQPFMAVGILIGAAFVWVVAAILRPEGNLQHIPLWLPPLPFAIVATVLFVFGVLAWRLGQKP